MTHFTLSRLGYPMLRELVTRGAERPITIQEAARFDQRPFGSMLHRGWIKFIPRKGFTLTHEGRAAWEDFNTGTITRTDETRPLTHYFDPAMYGLKPPPKKTAKKVATAV